MQPQAEAVTSKFSKGNFCAMDPFESLVNPTDPFSEKMRVLKVTSIFLESRGQNYFVAYSIE